MRHWRLCGWKLTPVANRKTLDRFVGQANSTSLLCAAQGSRPLPPQAHLLTLKRLHNDKLLVRLAHLYQAGEEGSGEHGARTLQDSSAPGDVSQGVSQPAACPGGQPSVQRSAAN